MAEGDAGDASGRRSDERIRDRGSEQGPNVFGAVEDSAAEASELPFDGAADAGPLTASEPPSCRRARPRCGVEDEEDCCMAPTVPAGTFAFASDALGTFVMVTLSSHRLERFEVTVGRAREFIAEYDAWRASGEPSSGLGRHPRIEGSGWRDDFTAALPPTGAELAQRWTSCGFSPFATLAAEEEGRASERVPLNCVTWYEAFAFCAWDGGRLPTLAELQYAGFGGAESRSYPWGNSPPDLSLASFGCNADETARPECLAAPTGEVGERPLGRGRFGQDDLAGSMAEWALDGAPAILESCSDCASLADVSTRTLRGGSWLEGPESLENGDFATVAPDVFTPFAGVRCARDQ